MDSPNLSLTSYSIDKLKHLLLTHEGYRQYPYRDTVGKLTIGIGRNLDERGISLDESFFLMNRDLESVEKELKAIYSFYERLCEARKIVLLDMGFNMGIPRLLTFRKFKVALEMGDYKEAALEMMDSKWARQVGNRATRLSYIMEFGKL